MLGLGVLTRFPRRLYTRVTRPSWLRFRSAQRRAARRNHYTTTLIGTAAVEADTIMIELFRPGRELTPVQMAATIPWSCESNPDCKAWLIGVWPGYGPRTCRKDFWQNATSVWEGKAKKSKGVVLWWPIHPNTPIEQLPYLHENAACTCGRACAARSKIEEHAEKRTG